MQIFPSFRCSANTSHFSSHKPRARIATVVLLGVVLRKQGVRPLTRLPRAFLLSPSGKCLLFNARSSCCHPRCRRSGALGEALRRLKKILARHSPAYPTPSHLPPYIALLLLLGSPDLRDFTSRRGKLTWCGQQAKSARVTPVAAVLTAIAPDYPLLPHALLLRPTNCTACALIGCDSHTYSQISSVSLSGSNLCSLQLHTARQFDSRRQLHFN